MAPRVITLAVRVGLHFSAVGNSVQWVTNRPTRTAVQSGRKSQVIFSEKIPPDDTRLLTVKKAGRYEEDLFSNRLSAACSCDVSDNSLSQPTLCRFRLL
jgi:hypothetical protein